MMQGPLRLSKFDKEYDFFAQFESDDEEGDYRESTSTLTEI
jgi:hypothetical protein